MRGAAQAQGQRALVPLQHYSGRVHQQSRHQAPLHVLLGADFGCTQNCRCRRHTRCSAAAVASDGAATRATVRKPPFPFTRIAGQEDMKLALMLNVVDPNIGGVLIMGDRGTGKSVAVRSITQVLPFIDVVEGDPFNSHPSEPRLMAPDARERLKAGEKLPATTMRTPLVELPLGATEDRICGTIDIERALSQGVKAFEPGLLARANRGILYVDEVNLLEDNLVDVVLDSAASGVNTVEREGVSIQHPARFILVGSGNPAEGEMRPQLLDRFGLAVNVGTLVSTDERLAMVLDRMRYDEDAPGLIAESQADMDALRAKLEAAQAALPQVTMDGDMMLKIATVCSELGIDGLRGDLVISRAARALVAYEGRQKVTEEDVRRVLTLCLTHRMRKDVLDEIDTAGLVVQLAWQRLTDPDAAQRTKEEKERREAARAEKEMAKEERDKEQNPPPAKKAGSWSGLPM